MRTTRLSHRLAYMALAAVCFFWGTTYLGIRIALEGLPPVFLIGIRYVISGALLLMGARLAGIAIPRGRELWLTTLCGAVGIGFGSSCLAVAELKIPSGSAALFYTAAPFWMVGIDALLPHGKRPRLATLLGLAIGMFGVAYMIYPAAVQEGMNGKTWPGFLLIQVSVVAWTLGSLLQKRVHSNAPAFVTGAMQQLGAGVVCWLAALRLEKFPAAVGARSVAAVAYLVVFGSIVGYSAFIYVVKNLPVAIVSIYYFVNPAVAVFLGWVFFREPFGMRSAIAVAIIFVGIAIVRWSEATESRKVFEVDLEGAGKLL